LSQSRAPLSPDQMCEKVWILPCPDVQIVSRDFYLWAYQRGITLDFSRPATNNALIESFNRKFRAECLNAHWFMGLDDGAAKMRGLVQFKGLRHGWVFIRRRAIEDFRRCPQNACRGRPKM
jgi:transposase InsO family protein